MLINLEGFQYDMSLDLNMVYYYIWLRDQAINIYTVIIQWGKYQYKYLPMGVSNFPYILQEKNN